MRFYNIDENMESDAHEPPLYVSINCESLIERLKDDLRQLGSSKKMKVSQNRRYGYIEITDYRPFGRSTLEVTRDDEIVTMSGAELMHKLTIQNSLTPLPEDYFKKENPLTTIELKNNMDTIGFPAEVVNFYTQNKEDAKAFLLGLKAKYPIYKLDKAIYTVNGDTDFMKLFYRCIDDTLEFDINLKARKKYYYQITS